MDDYPTLTYSGFSHWNPSRKTKSEYNKEFMNDRKSLSNAENEVTICLNWLKLVNKIKTINNYNSYGLKHVVERWTHPREYIANGSFIVAAIIAGFDVKYNTRTLNACFNISQKSIKKFNQG